MQPTKETNVLIVQGSIPHYRKAVFNLLAERYNVTVIHSGSRTVMPLDNYREKITPVKKVCVFNLQEGVISELKRGIYDVVIVMFDLRWPYNLLALFYKKYSRILLWGHRYGKNPVANYLRDISMKYSDGIILYSTEDIPEMVRRGITQSSIYVAHNTMYVKNHSDLSMYAKNSFLYVGRAQKRKGIDQLLIAFAELRPNLPENIKINIVGEGDENIKLKKLAEKLGINDKVVFYGEVTDEQQLKSLFQEAYAYVSPGHIGLGVMHSFAYGVPVITSASALHAQEFFNLENKKNSLLFNDFEDFKKSLMLICSDLNNRLELGREAYMLYSNERKIENMVDGFNCAINNVADIDL